MSIIKKYAAPVVVAAGIGGAGLTAHLTQPPKVEPPAPPAVVKTEKAKPPVKAKAKKVVWERKCYPEPLYWPTGGKACYYEEKK